MYKNYNIYLYSFIDIKIDINFYLILILCIIFNLTDTVSHNSNINDILNVHFTFTHKTSKLLLFTSPR